ncbi:MAG: hypothetical protein COB16_19735, partial [Rhodobacteraceae bacterium]
SGEWFFRFVILDHLFHKLIHLNYWSEFPRPPLIVELLTMRIREPRLKNAASLTDVCRIDGPDQSTKK